MPPVRLALSRATLRNSLNVVVHEQVSVVGTNDGQVIVNKNGTNILTLTDATATRITAAGMFQIDATEGTFYAEVLRKGG